MCAADFFNALGFAVPADAAELDINDAAGFQFDGGQCVPGIVDAFVEADGRLNLGLQFRMRVNVVPMERLLDHEQLKFIELSEMGGVFEAVSGIRVYRKEDFGKLFADCINVFQIFSRFNLQLDALVSAAELFFYFFHQGLRIFANAERYSAGNLFQRAAEQL